MLKFQQSAKMRNGLLSRPWVLTTELKMCSRIYVHDIQVTAYVGAFVGLRLIG
jgi:hypothetical protein